MFYLFWRIQKTDNLNEMQSFFLQKMHFSVYEDKKRNKWNRLPKLLNTKLEIWFERRQRKRISHVSRFRNSMQNPNLQLDRNIQGVLKSHHSLWREIQKDSRDFWRFFLKCCIDWRRRSEYDSLDQENVSWANSKSERDIFVTSSE